MKQILFRTFFGGDGTDYRREGLGAWLAEAFGSFFCFFGPIAVCCGLMVLAHKIGLF